MEIEDIQKNSNDKQYMLKAIRENPKRNDR